VIATNAPPMNEFIKDGFNGLLVDVSLPGNAQRQYRLPGGGRQHDGPGRKNGENGRR